MSGDRQSHAKTSLEPYKQASYPYVLKSHFSKFNGKTASFVGKIKSNTGDKLVLTNKDDEEVRVESFNGDTSLEGYIEVRGNIKSSDTIKYTEHNKFNNEFNIEQWETMVEMYQNTFSKLCYA